jgi:hypothetical protein
MCHVMVTSVSHAVRHDVTTCGASQWVQSQCSLDLPHCALRVPSGVIDPCGGGISGRTLVPYCLTGASIMVTTLTAMQYNVVSTKWPLANPSSLTRSLACVVPHGPPIVTTCNKYNKYYYKCHNCFLLSPVNSGWDIAWQPSWLC